MNDIEEFPELVKRQQILEEINKITLELQALFAFLSKNPSNHNVQKLVIEKQQRLNLTLLQLENFTAYKDNRVKFEPITPDSRSKVFISYCHKDIKWLEKLTIFLKPLETILALDIWDDRKIRAGLKWEEEITDALTSANIAILLISATFFASDFIMKNELPPILEKADKDGLIILSLFLSPISDRVFATSKLKPYQPINNPSRPLKILSSGKQDEILAKMTDMIYDKVIEPTKKD